MNYFEDQHKHDMPERYFTPQIIRTLSTREIVYEATPKPESVIFHKNSRVAKSESCCIPCLLACFICFAVKGEGGKSTIPERY